MDRKARRKFIEQLVNDRKIETQDELLRLLTEAGVETTQATISRDIHALNIVKANDGQGHTYYVQLHLAPEHDFNRLYQGIHDNVRTIETVQFLNVVKTALNSSYATILAGMFDELDIPEVVGTLAGNDTLIIISKDNADAKLVYNLIAKHINTRIV
ncbi:MULTISPECIES: arginine repressor [Limosilactobacillus]|jgi:transcriptional regulator of arginine metabolism|uniref:arginine repressor n=1 Tax=Limosilactobacillus TaxID=2742598 RepID=UPI002263C495|nr:MULTISPECIES: arginine repressor [Limosilactobacillus]MCH3922298.1 arginine repressor [Limosilactobacillus sp.]MCH3929070.1 arginine repressor [Limosilactobacillus sp.]